MSTTVTDGGWTAHFGIPTILYGPGSLEEAHSVDEKIEDQNYKPIVMFSTNSKSLVRSP